MKRLIVAALASLTLTAIQAHAAKIWSTGDECTIENCRAVHIQGDIERSDFDEFAHIVASEHIKHSVVYLDSLGGSVMASVQIGDTIRAMGFSSYVADNTTCVSACAMIWLAGAPRYAAPTAKIGFHHSYRKDPAGNITPTTPEGEAVVTNYYARLGIAKPAISFLLSAEPKQMYWLNADLAKGFGIDYIALSIAKQTTPVAPAAVPPPAPLPAAHTLAEARATAKAELKNCDARFPDNIKQAVAKEACVQNAVRVTRPFVVRNLDLFDQYMALRRLIAEQIQSGKITPAEGTYRLEVELSHNNTEAQTRSRAQRGLSCTTIGIFTDCD
jgi:hypothetical protein